MKILITFDTEPLYISNSKMTPSYISNSLGRSFAWTDDHIISVFDSMIHRKKYGLSVLKEMKKINYELFCKQYKRLVVKKIILFNHFVGDFKLTRIYLKHADIFITDDSIEHQKILHDCGGNGLKMIKFPNYYDIKIIY